MDGGRSPVYNRYGQIVQMMTNTHNVYHRESQRGLKLRQGWFDAVDDCIQKLPAGPSGIVLEFLALPIDGPRRVDKLQTAIVDLEVEIDHKKNLLRRLQDQLEYAVDINELNRGRIDLRIIPDQYDVECTTKEMSSYTAQMNVQLYQQEKMRLEIEHIMYSGELLHVSDIWLFPMGESDSEAVMTVCDPVKVPEPRKRLNPNFYHSNFEGRRVVMQRRREGKCPRFAEI